LIYFQKSLKYLKTSITIIRPGKRGKSVWVAQVSPQRLVHPPRCNPGLNCPTAHLDNLNNKLQEFKSALEGMVDDGPPANVSDDPPAIVSDNPPAIVSDDPPAIVSDDPPAIVSDDPPAIISDEKKGVPFILFCHFLHSSG
jgi:hypothetical protein